MLLSANEKCEFRIKREYTSSSGKVSYFYTFENDNMGSFELWSNKSIEGLKKGDSYRLSFDLHFYQGNKQIDLVEVVPYDGK